MAWEEGQAQTPPDERLWPIGPCQPWLPYVYGSPWVILNFYQPHFEKHEVVFPTGEIVF